jgi:predicted neuraminidase
MRGFVASNGMMVFPAFWAEGCDQLRPGDLGTDPTQWSSDWNLSESRREYRSVCGLLASTDGGRTFRVRGYVAHPDVNLWEPTAAEVSPGHFVMLMRAERTGVLFRSESHDSGETWSAPESTEILNPSTKPTCLKIGDAILLFHNPNPGIGFFQRKQVEVWISRDGMKTWPQKIPLANANRSDRPVCYPDPIYLPDSHEIAVVLDTARKAHLQRIPCTDLGLPRIQNERNG